MEMSEYLYQIVKHFHLCGKKKKTDKQRNKRNFDGRQRRTSTDYPKLIVGSEVRVPTPQSRLSVARYEYDSPKLIVDSEVRVSTPLKLIVDAWGSP